MISDFLDNGKNNTCFASNANAIIPAPILAAYEVSCRVSPAHPLPASIDVYKILVHVKWSWEFIVYFVWFQSSVVNGSKRIKYVFCNTISTQFTRMTRIKYSTPTTVKPVQKGRKRLFEKVFLVHTETYFNRGLTCIHCENW